MDIDTRNQAIRSMADGGMTYVEIGKRFDLTGARVAQIVKLEKQRRPTVILDGMTERERNNKIYQADLNYVRIGYKQGLTVKQMANALRTNEIEIRHFITKI